MIKYKEYSYSEYKDREDEIESWIKRNLKKDGIELRLKKVIELLSIVGEHYLIENPDKLDDVVRAIECEGYNHTIKVDDVLRQQLN